jgi:hypothetical protein
VLGELVVSRAVQDRTTQVIQATLQFFLTITALVEAVEQEEFLLFLQLLF